SLLELAVEQLVPVLLGFHLLLEALLALGGLLLDDVERAAEVLRGALHGWGIVRDDGAELGVDGERGLTAGAGDGEGLHGRDASSGGAQRQATGRAARGAGPRRPAATPP